MFLMHLVNLLVNLLHISHSHKLFASTVSISFKKSAPKTSKRLRALYFTQHFSATFHVILIRNPART